MIVNSEQADHQVTDVTIEQQEYGALYEVIDDDSVTVEFRWAMGERSLDEIALGE